MLPTTPVRQQTQQSTLLQSTPQTRGTAAHVSYHEQHTQGDYAPYITEDLRAKKDIPLDEFCKYVFPNLFDQHQNTVDQVANSATLKSLLEKYRQPVRHETHRYHPFTELVNTVVDALRKELGKIIELNNLVFCRNDPVFIVGSHACRKPDVVGVAEETISKHQGRISVDNLSDQGPSEAPFAWHELLLFIEFKLVQPEIVHTGTAQRRPSAKSKPKASSARSGTSTSHDATSISRGGTSTGRSATLPPKIQPLRQPVSKKRTSHESSVPHRTVTTRSMNKEAGPVPSPDNSGNVAPRSTPSAPVPQSNPKDSRDVVRRSKPDEQEMNKIKADLPTQCASYALEMMSHSGLRHHVIGASIVDDEITFQYYNHSHILYSEPLNFIADFPRFLSVLLLLMSLKRKDWGFSTVLPAPIFQTPSDHLYQPILSLFRGQSIRLGAQSYELGDIIHQQHGIIGRGTCVIEAQTEQNVDVVIKFSWPASERVLEEQFLHRAHEDAKDERHGDIAKHLPTLLHHAVDDYWKKNQSDYEQRYLQIIAFNKLCPITQLTQAKNLANAIRGIFRCYKWLYQVPHILHRDISINNFMYRELNGQICGVLNDFDLAYQMTNDHPASVNPTSRQRTGTLPFMSIDLLHDNPPPHGYRHDLESFLWVILFHIGQYKDGISLGKAGPYYNWLLGDHRKVQLEKLNILSGIKSVVVQPAFEPLRCWITEMIEMFDYGHFAAGQHRKRGQADFKVESSGGFITLEKFEKILEIEITG